jgi:hypothetical protein
MKTYGGVGVYIHVFFTWALDGGEWSASRHGRIISGERVIDTHWIGPRIGLDDGESPYRDSNSSPSVVQPVCSRYTDCAIRLSTF